MSLDYFCQMAYATKYNLPDRFTPGMDDLVLRAAVALTAEDIQNEISRLEPLTPRCVVSKTTLDFLRSVQQMQE